MNKRNLQAWGLAIAGLLGLLALVPSNSIPLRLALLVGALLFILSVPAIRAVHPEGSAGLIGLILIEIGAVIALALAILSQGFGSNLGSAIAFVAALCGAVGRLIVGGLTGRGTASQSWPGWAFIVSGLANLAGGLVASNLAPTLGIVAVLAETAALVGFGLRLRGSVG